MARKILTGMVAPLMLLSLGSLSAADVQPGDIVTAENREKLRGLVPEELYPFTVENFPELHMTIVETQPYPVHPKYVEATAQYGCQASLDEHGQLVNYTAGQPFPYSEWAKEATQHACDLTSDDPQYGLKLAWNVNYRWQGPGADWPHWGQSFWRARGDNTWKIAQGTYRRTYFSHRADLLPETTSIVPDTDIEWAEYSETMDPFDLRGTGFLVFRYLKSREKADDAWMYVPSLRRVQRISVSQKADSVQGTDMTLEDFFLFSGYVWDQEWRFRGEPTVLAVMDTQRTCFPRNFRRPGSDGFGQIGSRDHFLACRFGPYKALPFVDETWQKRTALQLEQIPKREGHPYQRRLLWYDKETLVPLMALSYDRAGKPFRMMWEVNDWSETNGIEGNLGKYVILIAAESVVNLQDGVSNLMQDFAANAKDFSPEETEKYFDVNRLKGGH